MKNTEPWGRPSELDGNGQAESIEDRDARELINEAAERFGNITWKSAGLSRTDVDNALMQQGVRSNDRRAKLINIGLEYEMIYKAGNKAHPKYFYKGNNPSDDVRDLPFEQEDKQSDAPF